MTMPGFRWLIIIISSPEFLSQTTSPNQVAMVAWAS